MHLYNDTDGAYDKLDVIIAVCRNDVFIACQKESIENLKGNSETDITKEFPELTDADTVKCFVWYSMKDMRPASAVYEEKIG